MRIGQRTTIAVIGLLTSFLMAGVTLAPAHATPADHPGNDKITVTRGPHGEAIIHLPSQTSPASIAAAAPTTSPAASQREWVPNGSTYACDSGYVCATVKYGAGYYVFRFYYYGTYALSNWYGDGYVLNLQTGGAAARVLDINGGQLVCVPTAWSRYVDWNPVWYIRLTSSPC